MLLIIIILITIATIIYFRKLKYANFNKIPGPKPLPIIGNILDLGTNLVEFLQIQCNLVKEYGPVVRLWIGMQPTILLADPEKIELILGSSRHVHKSKTYNGFKIWLGNGIFNSSDVNHWAKHRKVILPTLSYKVTNEYSYYINSNSITLIKKLDEQLHVKSLDIYPFINLFALDVINEAAMKTKINTQLNGNSEYVDAVKGFLRIHLSKVYSTYKNFNFVFKMTREGKEQQHYANIMHSFTDKIIRLRKEERKNTKEKVKNLDDFGIKEKKSFLDHLLDLEKNENKLTDKELREEVDTFMFGGHDTISSAVSFCILELSKHPDVQNRLVEESNNILGEDKTVEIHFNEVNEMKYLDRVVKECMRIYTTVPYIEREIHEDITIDGLNIPKHTVFQISLYALHRNEKHFPDPESFDPDRFLPENVQSRHPYAYIPFSAGPRNCIGWKYGLLSTKCVVIKLLRHFEIHPAHPYCEPILSNNAILESVNGINVQLKKR